MVVKRPPFGGDQNRGKILLFLKKMLKNGERNL